MTVNSWGKYDLDYEMEIIFLTEFNQLHQQERK